MRIKNLHYVFSFILILFIGLSEPGFAQKVKTQKGSASWYGSRYHGRKTSSGEVYNKNHMTAAHPFLPFGTKVKVTNTQTDQTVIVRINDRGPFGKRGYIIDLSEAAARKIGAIREGSAPVTVEVLPGQKDAETEPGVSAAPTTAPTDTTQIKPSIYFVIQAGSFADETNAKLQSEKLKAIKQDLPVMLNAETVNGKKVHRVVAGHFNSRNEAEAFKAELTRKGIPVLVKQIPVAS